ncbi:hypothetical protein H5410_002324 [Solanum commersonii]|uniref:Uncharacterized protein n=1 Tax=Solanum commersonii TaxID=4109 RepID=A0A9J6B2J7_SOLCO|nr:hypothetical protein H5410_002324 [Solanum commersonii]
MYHTSFLASFLGGAIRAGVPGLAVLEFLSLRYLFIYFPLQSNLICQIYLIVQFLPIYEDFLILLIGCYSLLSTPQNWTEASYLDDIRDLGACCGATLFFFMTLPLIYALNAMVFVFLAIVVICVEFILYKFQPDIGKNKVSCQKKRSGSYIDFGRKYFQKKIAKMERSTRFLY